MHTMSAGTIACRAAHGERVLLGDDFRNSLLRYERNAVADPSERRVGRAAGNSSRATEIGICQKTALRISHRVYVMGHGLIVFGDRPAELKGNDVAHERWLEV
jgi:hypothetical protein